MREGFDLSSINSQLPPVKNSTGLNCSGRNISLKFVSKLRTTIVGAVSPPTPPQVNSLFIKLCLKRFRSGWWKFSSALMQSAVASLTGMNSLFSSGPPLSVLKYAFSLFAYLTLHDFARTFQYSLTAGLSLAKTVSPPILTLNLNRSYLLLSGLTAKTQDFLFYLVKDNSKTIDMSFLWTANWGVGGGERPTLQN